MLTFEIGKIGFFREGEPLSYSTTYIEGERACSDCNHVWTQHMVIELS